MTTVTTAARSGSRLQFYNANRGRWELPLFGLLKSMGVEPSVAKRMGEQQLCPCCGDPVPQPVGVGKVSLCDTDFAIFQSLTRFDDGKTLGEKIARLDRVGLQQVIKGERNILPPKEMVESLTGKSLEQAGSESMGGYCPCCEKPHGKSTRHLVAGPDGKNRKIIFCPGCFDLYRRRNKFAVAIAKMARKDLL